MKQEPDDTAALAGRAHLLALSGRGAEAVDDYRRLLALTPADADAWFNMGFVLERLQRWDDAARAFRECLRRAPAHEAAARHLAALQPGAATQRRSAHATGPSPAPSAVVRAPRLAAR